MFLFLDVFCYQKRIDTDTILQNKNDKEKGNTMKKHALVISDHENRKKSKNAHFKDVYTSGYVEKSKLT